jgi:hypothetical protein
LGFHFVFVQESSPHALTIIGNRTAEEPNGPQLMELSVHWNAASLTSGN